MRLTLDKVNNGWILTEVSNTQFDGEVFVFQSLWDMHTHLQNIERRLTNQSVIPPEEAF